MQPVWLNFSLSPILPSSLPCTHRQVCTQLGETNLRQLPWLSSERGRADPAPPNPLKLPIQSYPAWLCCVGAAEMSQLFYCYTQAFLRVTWEIFVFGLELRKNCASSGPWSVFDLCLCYLHQQLGKRSGFLLWLVGSLELSPCCETPWCLLSSLNTPSSLLLFVLLCCITQLPLSCLKVCLERDEVLMRKHIHTVLGLCCQTDLAAGYQLGHLPSHNFSEP